ncbi:MAG: hypothetical protein SGJ27_28515 [Candidatus Melainabacteria bacterium]|nr:hypothetical protein [Candidatus Melainabacteria bacterium]
MLTITIQTSVNVALAAIVLCLVTGAADAASTASPQQMSPQHSRLTPYAVNKAQYGENGAYPHPDLLDAMGKTEQIERQSNPVQYTGSEHTPNGQSSKSQNRCYSPNLGEMGIAKGGTSEKGPCVGKLGAGQTFYENKNPEDDGVVDKGNGRKIPPNDAYIKMTSPFQYDYLKIAERALADTRNERSLVGVATVKQISQSVEGDGRSEVGKTMQSTQAAMSGIAECASEAMAEEFNFTWLKMLSLSATPLTNVGNTASGSACKSSKPVKTYGNAIYIVQQAYSHIYLPIAILLLLPGAVATQLKSLLQSGILNNHHDDDAVSPFSGILKALVAIFLIPASQLIVSYSIDVGNSMQFEISRHINYINLFAYADEQVFAPPADSFPGKILPTKALKSLGKLQGTPEKLAKRFNMSMASVMLQGLANSMSQAAAFGLVIACAFQTIMACYLLLLGPIAAAFYAWPLGAGSMFSKVFSGWVDGIVNLALWRFWWCVVLLVMDTRLGWLSGAGLLDVYSMWELLMFISFLVIMSTVPFNPFDFKPGDMVQRIMDKSDEAVQEAANRK